MKIRTLTNQIYEGTPTEIVRRMRKASRTQSRTLKVFMRDFANRCLVINPHARIRHNDETYFLADLASQNFIQTKPDHEKPEAGDPYAGKETYPEV